MHQQLAEVLQRYKSLLNNFASESNTCFQISDVEVFADNRRRKRKTIHVREN